MTAPLPADDTDPTDPEPDGAGGPTLRILPVPDTEPPFDPDPFWDRPRLAAVPRAARRPPDRPREPDERVAESPFVEPVGPPGAQEAAEQLVRHCLEVLDGRRRLAQVCAVATAEGAECLRRELAGRVSPRRVLRSRGVYVTEPRPGVAECVTTLFEPDRARAMAIRLEHHGGWLCAHVQIIEPAAPPRQARPTRPAAR